MVRRIITNRHGPVFRRTSHRTRVFRKSSRRSLVFPRMSPRDGVYLTRRGIRETRAAHIIIITTITNMAVLLNLVSTSHGANTVHEPRPLTCGMAGTTAKTRTPSPSRVVITPTRVLTAIHATDTVIRAPATARRIAATAVTHIAMGDTSRTTGAEMGPGREVLTTIIAAITPTARIRHARATLQTINMGRIITLVTMGITASRIAGAITASTITRKIMTLLLAIVVILGLQGHQDLGADRQQCKSSAILLHKPYMYFQLVGSSRLSRLLYFYIIKVVSR